MKTKFGFLERIRFTGTLAIIVVILSVFLVGTHSFKSAENIYTSSKISNVEYTVIETEDSENIIEDRENLEYSPIEDISMEYFGIRESKDLIIKFNVEPIRDTGTYLLLGTSKRFRDYVELYNEDGIMINSYPQKLSYDNDGRFKYYLLPETEETNTYYAMFEKEYHLSVLNRPSFMVGTESDLLLMEGYNSLIDLVFACALVLAGTLIYIMFHISSVEKYHIVKIFAMSFFLISAQCIVFSPFASFAFDEYADIFLIMKNILYYLTCASIYIIPLMYARNKESRNFYKINIIVTLVWMIVSSYLLLISSPHVLLLGKVYNIYFIIVALGAFATNVYSYENETYIVSVFRIVSFISLVVLNIIFYMCESIGISGSFGTAYYLILSVFALSVIGYICSIFYYRGKFMKDNKNFLYDEKATLDRIYNSNKKNITTKNIQEIAENILGDIKGIYPDLSFGMIIHRDLNKNMTIPGYTEMKGDIERQANKVFKRYYKRIPNSTYSTHFSSDTAVLLFRSSNGESLMIYIKNKKPLTELDQIASEIFASPVLLSFNNCRIYDEIINTEKELLYAVGNLMHIKCETYGNLWRIGEYTYLLAKTTGLTEQVAANLRIASYIHDIGKVGMNDQYINIEKVSHKEKHLFYEHTKIGYDMLSKFSGDIMKLAAVCSLYHHEQYNGKGYIGKVADEVPIEVRIAIICMEFDSYYCKLDKDKNLSKEELLAESLKYLNSNKQSLFDPLLVQLFTKVSEDIEKIIEESESNNK